MSPLLIQLSELLPAFGDWLWRASLMGGLLAAAVLLARSVLGERLSPTVRGVLWIIVLVRLVLPWSPTAPFSAYNLLPWLKPTPAIAPELALAARSLQANPPIEVSRSSPTQTTTSVPRSNKSLAHQRSVPSTGWSVTGILLLIWSLGAGVVMTVVLIGVFRSRRLAGRARQLADERSVNALEAAKRELGLSGPIMLAESPDCPAPLVMGFLRPVVLMPAGLARSLSDREIRDIVLHELSHVRRRDILVSWFSAAVLVLHWFNPLVWLATRAMRQDREPACDRLALKHLPEQDRLDYGRTLVAMVERLGSENAGSASRTSSTRALTGLAAVVEDADINSSTLHRRIGMITRYIPSSRRSVVLTSIALAAIALLTLTQATLRAQGPSSEFSFYRYILDNRPVDEHGLIRSFPGATLELEQSGVLWSGEEKELNKRIGLMLVEPNSPRRPFMVAFTDRDARNFWLQLRTAALSRQADLANVALASQLAPEPTALEMRISLERLKPAPVTGLSPFSIGSFYIHPNSPELPHLPVQVTFQAVMPDSPMTWVAEAKLPAQTALALADQLAVALKARGLDANPPAIPSPSERRAAARADLKYAFDLGGGLQRNDKGELVSSTATTMRIVSPTPERPDGRIRIEVIDTLRKERAGEPIATFVLSKEESRKFATDLVQASRGAMTDGPAKRAMDILETETAKREGTTPEAIRAEHREIDAILGPVAFNVQPSKLRFVANRPPYAPETSVVSVQPLGQLSTSRIGIVLSEAQNLADGQNWISRAFITLEESRRLAMEASILALADAPAEP